MEELWIVRVVECHGVRDAVKGSVDTIDRIQESRTCVLSVLKRLKGKELIALRVITRTIIPSHIGRVGEEKWKELNQLICRES